MITRFNLYENKKNDNSIIDYTFLKNHTTIDEIKKACNDSIENNVYAIVVSTENIGTAKAFLEESDIKTITVIDSPKGDSSLNIKKNHIMNAIIEGVDEIDLVMNYLKLKELSILDEDKYLIVYNEIQDEIQSLSTMCHKNGVLLKVIIEIEELHFEQIKIACEICENSSVDFIQTSTGFSKKTPNWEEKIEKIKYIRRILSNNINIKVSGGIRTQEQIDELKSIGIDRIGTSVFI